MNTLTGDWATLPTPVLEVMCAFLSTSDIKALKLVCSSFARRIGSSHSVRLRLTARKLAWEKMMEPQRRAARAAWRSYAESQREANKGEADEGCALI